MKIRGLFSILVLFLATISYGQRGKYASFKNIETKYFGEESLASMAWAPSGEFWAVSPNGIIKHNGNSKKLFSKTDKNYLVGNDIIGIQKTETDEMWITYRDTNWITKLNPLTESFEHYEIPELHNDTVLTGIVVRIKKEEDGQFWLCTWGNGLIKFNEGRTPNQVYVFDKCTYEVPETLGGSGISGKGNGKGSGTGTGKARRDGRKNKVADAGLFVKDIIIQKDGRFLITFFNGRAGIASFPGFFDPKTEEYNTINIDAMTESYSEQLRKNIRVAAQIVHWAHQDENGKYWLGTYSGPLYMDLENNSIKRISEKGQDPFMQNQVNALSYVRSGSELWITTFNKGVMVVDVNTHDVNFHYSDPVNTSSIASNKTRGISVDPFNNLWIANGKGILSVYTPYLHTFKMMYWKDMDLEYSNRSNQNIPVNQLYVENSKEIYVSSRVGLLKYDFATLDVSDKYVYDHIVENMQHGRKRGVEHFKIMGDEAFVSFDTYPHMLDLETKELTMIGNAYGMGMIGFRHEPKMERRIYIHSGWNGSFIAEYEEGQAQSKTIMKLPDAQISETFSFITNQGNWIFSEGVNGVGRFVICNEKDSTYKLFSPSREASFFPDSTVKCALVQEGSDEILIGTATDLYTFNEVTYETEKISTKVGMKEGEGVFTMITDDNGNIWLALASELICWNPNKEEYLRYGKSYGVDVSNFLPAIGQKDELGNLYFANMYGVLIFHPDEVVPPTDSLIVSISDIRVNETSLGKDFGQFLAGEYNLPYDQNNFEFDFYTNQIFEVAPHSYSYQLEGQSERWVSCGSNPNVRLDNLQYGEYQLHFKAQNAYGVESDVFTIPFKVNRPFWLSWWFIALMALLLAVLVYLLVKGRMKALKKRSELLEQTVTERTAEVVEQKKEAEMQRAEAELQKEIVEEKQQEITDSITYAKRIQDAILPSAAVVESNLPDSFVMYRPKDIVAGDFYWMQPLSESELIFAAADCTGHGVPGAMVSVVCNNALNRTVREFQILDPGKLLDNTRQLVIEQFEQSIGGTTSRDETIKDGMDISVCHLNKETLVMNWAGANNPLWIIRNGELIEIKGDKQPVGQFEPSSNFTSHQIQLDKEDRFYIFSDGYADQFGGEKGKKFKSSSLKKLLLSIHELPMTEQLNALEEQFDSWKGDYEQLDDVCVIGVRV